MVLCGGFTAEVRAKKMSEMIGLNYQCFLKGSFNIRIPSELHRRLALEATRHDMSLNQFIKDTLTQAVAAEQV